MGNINDKSSSSFIQQWRVNSIVMSHSQSLITGQCCENGSMLSNVLAKSNKSSGYKHPIDVIPGDCSGGMICHNRGTIGQG